MPAAAQRLIANHANRLASAVITATNQRPAGDPRLIGMTRAGLGTMALTGPYTGPTDQLIDIEITSGTGTELRPSAPAIIGVGNGQLAVTGVDASAVPETVTFRLTSTGQAGTRARLEFFGVTLMARAEGLAGNAIEISVTRRLTLSDPLAATLAELPAGQATLPDARFDYGAVAATDSGIPAAAPRIQFERFSQIHRHWKAWENNAWAFKLDPAPAYAIPADTPVRTVTGDYLITVTDGATTETYEAITHYDFLSQVRATSALLEVVGTVARDTAPGGLAVLDIQLRTDAYALPPLASISGRYGAKYLDAVAILDPAAVTENITLTRRAGNDGAAGWEVKGAASGSYPDAYMGLPYASGPVGFTIPAREVPPEALGRITSHITYADRTEGESEPAICVKRLTAGVAATAKSVTFEYKRRPARDCDCSSLTAPPLSMACLGLTGGDNLMALDPAYQSRLETLYDWRAEFIASNADFSSPDDARSAVYDMDLCDQATQAFADTLAQIWESSDALTAWDAEMSRMDTEFTALEGIAALGTAPVYLTADQSLADVSSVAPGVKYLNPTNGQVYLYLGAFLEYNIYTDERLGVAPCSGRGCSNPPSESEFSAKSCAISDLPEQGSWPVPLGTLTMCKEITTDTWCGTTITYGVFTRWEHLGADGQLISGGAGAGEGTDLRNPEIKDYNDVTGTEEAVSWYSRAAEQLVRKYTARMDAVLTIAGIVPKAQAGSLRGDGCWRDNEEATSWWEDTSGYYLPAFTGDAYVSSVMDAERGPQSTKEFGFAILVDCEDRLKDGDKVTITIRGGQVGAYQEGDRFTIPVIAAAPAPLTGGEDGDSIHTWVVEGSDGGRYPDWLWQPSSPSAYAAGPLDATLAPGGIPFEPGDEIRVALEGGELRWRIDGGSWTTADLFTTDQALGNGLTLNAVQASTPSFVAGDTWHFRAEATYGVDRLRQPREASAFAFDGSTTQIDIDLGTARPIETVLLALHSLPETASAVISAGAAAIGEWTLTLPWRPGPMVGLTLGGASARYLRLTITGAGAGAEIGWLWAGTPWTPTAPVSSLTHVHQYGLTRGSGRNPGALYRGRGTGGKWAWSLDAGSLLLPADISALTAILDHIAANGLEWVCLVPDTARLETATLAQIDADEVTITEHLGFALDGDTAASAELPFRAVLR